MDPDWIVRWWAGRVVACLESIARSLREKP